MAEEKVIIENEGQKIVGILHKSDKPNDKLVILVHGFTGDMDGPGGLFIPFANKLSKDGFDVFRFNFRFTTKDWSLFQNVTISGEVSDLKKIISVMSVKYKKIGILGESLGGIVSIMGYNNKVNVLVLWYPPGFLLETSLNRFSSIEKSKEAEKTGYVIEKKHNEIFKIGKSFIEEVKTIDVIPFAKKIKCPVFIVHGDKDTRVPIDQSERLIKILREPKKLAIIQGANHAWKDMDYKDPILEFQNRAMNLTIDWFKRWLK